jgi:hypothetical protein
MFPGVTGLSQQRLQREWGKEQAFPFIRLSPCFLFYDADAGFRYIKSGFVNTMLAFEPREAPPQTKTGLCRKP